MFQAKAVDKIKTHILCSKFLLQNFAVYEMMLKSCRVDQAIDESMALARCNSGYLNPPYELH
jgi:hypothetical protein